MTHLQAELLRIEENAIEMMELARQQLSKSYTALINSDAFLAEEIMRNEIRVDALEMSIDKDCENILALYQPVAIDLRFVICVLKNIGNLERIGDHANGVARFIAEYGTFQTALIEALQIKEMYQACDEMFDLAITSMEKRDGQIAREIFKKDKSINKINKKAPEIIQQALLANPEATKEALFLFRAMGKIERTGDLLKNIAEEIIFFIEAEVLRHAKKERKLPKNDEPQ